MSNYVNCNNFSNSRGIVAGGQDRAFLDHFGPAYVHELQSALQARFGGEQPADAALVLPTDHPVQRWVVHVACFPHRPDTAYAAMSAMLEAIDGAADGVKAVACSGLGTYTGCSHMEETAAQMRAAYDAQRHRASMSRKDSCGGGRSHSMSHPF